MATTSARGMDPVDVGAAENLTTRLFERETSRASKEILRHPVDGSWVPLTWGQLASRVREVAAGLIASGVGEGDRVVLMAGTRVEWTVADLAILAAGGVTVPVYETSSVEQCSWILADSGAVLAIAATPDHAKSLDVARTAELREILVIDDGGLDDLAGRGDDAKREEVAQRAAARTQRDLATIVYTAGTTGNPKGCMLTHGNLLWTARQNEIYLSRLFTPQDSTLLFLPLAHSFARIIQFGCLESDVIIGYARGVDTLIEDLQSFRPTFLLAVPRVFEKVFNTAQRKATGAKAKIFDRAVAVAEQWSSTAEPSAVLRLQHTVMDKLVYAKLRAAIGGRVAYCVSGGAPLANHIARFFHAAGITILEGYGLTETSAPATVNTPDAMRIGTVGKPLPGVEIKLADDGEILIRGGNVFSGYFHNDAATAEVLDADGWFASGDIGAIDGLGFLRITGRKKEIIVTAGGKNVAPAVLEERLLVHRLVGQAMVVGDNRPFIAALVSLDPDEGAAFATQHGISGGPQAWATDERVRAEVSKAVDHANAAVSKAESIRNFAIAPREFTQEHGEVTPSMKLKRNAVAANFSDTIEQLYTKP